MKQKALNDKIVFKNQFNETIQNFTANIDFLVTQQKDIEEVVSKINNNSSDTISKLQSLNKNSREVLKNLESSENSLKIISKNKENKEIHKEKSLINQVYDVRREENNRANDIAEQNEIDKYGSHIPLAEYKVDTQMDMQNQYSQNKYYWRKKEKLRK